ncbi:HAD family hydrolase [Amycolatopsis rubida]|uniref:FMN phosphatase YigB, HAD superfamily n=1 Tax=Amycolatopsis rubida TaxID=112413 RepID=A0A1I5XAW0_9PSEU|nr:HAD family hydrolase [Amycolatopsis rubida]SFQ28996.1 FMN phosphatase YigB, HAD superfamily [Amycolatopsis rubida]
MSAIKLLVFDAVRTLGVTTGVRMHEFVQRLSPLPAADVDEACRTFAHRTPMPDGEAMESFCEEACVDPADLPPHWFTGTVPDLPQDHPHWSGFAGYDYAPSAVADMIEMTGGAPAVVLSNIPSTTGPMQLAALHRQFPMLDAVYASYDLGKRKPDRRLWERIAADYGVETHQLMHFGDLWKCDVLGATRAGAHAVFLAGTRPEPNPPEDRARLNPRARVFVADTLHEARACVREMTRGGPTA